MLKNKRVNVRYGPSLNYPVKFVYTKKHWYTSILDWSGTGAEGPWIVLFVNRNDTRNLRRQELRNTERLQQERQEVDLQLA